MSLPYVTHSVHSSPVHTCGRLQVVLCKSQHLTNTVVVVAEHSCSSGVASSVQSVFDLNLPIPRQCRILPNFLEFKKSPGLPCSIPLLRPSSCPGTCQGLYTIAWSTCVNVTAGNWIGSNDFKYMNASIYCLSAAKFPRHRRPRRSASFIASNSGLRLPAVWPNLGPGF